VASARIGRCVPGAAPVGLCHGTQPRSGVKNIAHRGSAGGRLVFQHQDRRRLVAPKIESLRQYAIDEIGDGEGRVRYLCSATGAP
jgi:hypothetical protein